jgi:hypothetical protein
VNVEVGGAVAVADRVGALVEQKGDFELAGLHALAVSGLPAWAGLGKSLSCHLPTKNGLLPGDPPPVGNLGRFSTLRTRVSGGTRSGRHQEDSEAARKMVP